jgi:hypothetical protein
MKLLACALGAAGAAALAVAAAAAFGPWPALSAAALCALWPSNAFYTSQNFKEAPTNLFAYLSLALLLPFATRREDRARAPRAAAGAACLILTGFYRSYVMLVVALALAAAFLAAWAARRAPRGRLGLGLAAALGGVVLFLPVSRAVTAHFFPGGMTVDPRNQPGIIPVTYEGNTARAYAPTSPRALGEFRRLRQEYDRQWAKNQMGREIGTQIYPEARFANWADVLAFLPKASFTVLFMPLPGLYPLDGKLGRLLAALENAFLLCLACLGLIGAARGPKTPPRLALLLVFFGMTAGSALLEFDLGSAGRHKLLYLPMLFPFAAEEALRLIKRGKDAARPIW